MHETLQTLLCDRRIWRGEVAGAPATGTPTGYIDLDEALPGGGWPTASLTEILIEHHGMGELALIMPALAHLSRGERVIVWVAPPFIPYAPALADAGLDLKRLLIVKPGTSSDILWAAEQALRSGSSAAVVVWAEPSTRWLRRLQLAAETGSSWGVLFRTADAQARSSYATLRLRVRAGELELLKCRGGRPRVLRTSWRTQG
jgi:hypothetical protein